MKKSNALQFNRFFCIVAVLTGGLYGTAVKSHAQQEPQAEPFEKAIERLVETQRPQAVERGGALTQLQDLAAVEARVIELLPMMRAATVHLQISLGSHLGGVNGSGVVIKDNYVLTAAHVTMGPGRPVKITFADGATANGKTLGHLPFDLRGRPGIADVGLIRITDEGDWPHVEMGDSLSIRPGDWCLAMGYPGGFDQERGPVLRMGRIAFSWPDRIWTDCMLLGGDSGGPLFDLDGRVIGINSRIAKRISVNFHAPVDAFKENWDQLAAGIVPSAPSSGAFLGVVTQKHEKGFLIQEVQGASAADKAGLKAGDVIIRINQASMNRVPSFEWIMQRLKPGDKIRLIVERGENTLPMKVTLDSKNQPMPDNEAEVNDGP